MNPILDLAIRASILMVLGLAGWKLARRFAAESRCAWLRATFVGLVILPLAFAIGPKWEAVIPWVTKPEPLVIDPVILAMAEANTPDPTPTSITWTTIAWIALGLAALLPSVLGWRSLRRLWREATPVGPELELELDKAVRGLGVKTQVRAKYGDTKTPLVFGCVRPHVLLPRAFADWPEAHRRSALLHEAAHIRRFDCAWLTLAGAVRAVYACHPLVWWLSGALKDETELAADERAIRSGVEATDYASALVAIARDLQRPGRLVHSQGVTFMNHRQLDRRVRGALSTRRRGFTFMGSLGLAVSAIGTALGISAVQPTMPQQEIVITTTSQAAPPVFEETKADLFGPLTIAVAEAPQKSKTKAKTVKSKAVKAKAATAPKVVTYQWVTTTAHPSGSYKVVAGSPAPVYTMVAPKLNFKVQASPNTFTYTIAPRAAATPSGNYVLTPTRAGTAVPNAPQAVYETLPRRGMSLSAPAAAAPSGGVTYVMPGQATAPAGAAASPGVQVIRDLPLLGHLFQPGQSAEDAKKARDIVQKLLENAKGKPEEEDLKKLLELISKTHAEATTVKGELLARSLNADAKRQIELSMVQAERAKVEADVARVRADQFEHARVLSGTNLRQLELQEFDAAHRKAIALQPQMRVADGMKLDMRAVEGMKLAETMRAHVVTQNNGTIEIVVVDAKGKTQKITVRPDQMKKTIKLQRGKDGKLRVIGG